jgi:hypothetical protein
MEKRQNLCERTAGIFQGRSMVREEPGCVDPHGHVSDFILYGLELEDGLAEG